MRVAAKLGRLGICKEELHSINSHTHLITWSSKIMRNIRFVKSLLHQGLWSSDLARWWLTMRNFHPQLHNLFNTCSLEAMWEIKNISTTTMPMTTKPDRVVTFNEELPCINSGDPFITWSCKVLLPVKYVMPLLPQGRCRTTWQGGELLKGVSSYKVTQPFKHLVFWDHATSRKVLSLP